MSTASSNKAKIARRVVEVLEYFDDTHREATVMDIVRRYNRPQSSTSELLSSLVELGLLYKDPYSRSYSLSPRAALLGAGGQTGPVRDGRLINLIDRVVAQTGMSVALFGQVGLKTQIVSWHSGAHSTSHGTRNLFGGLQEPLCDNAAGWLILSTQDASRCDGVLRRLNAEASDDRKFQVPEMVARLQFCREHGYVRGTAGFGSTAEVIARLLPAQSAEHPLAIGFVFDAQDRVNPENLLQCLDDAIDQYFGHHGMEAAVVRKFPTAA